MDVERQPEAASLMDPTDLKIVKPDVHVSMLKGYKLGLHWQSEAEVMRLRAMDTEEELVVHWQIVNHDIFQNVEEHKVTGARLRTKPRKQWRFEASKFINLPMDRRNGYLGQKQISRQHWIGMLRFIQS